MLHMIARTSSLPPCPDHCPSHVLPSGRFFSTLPGAQLRLSTSAAVGSDDSSGDASAGRDSAAAAAAAAEAANSISRCADISQGVGSMDLKAAGENLDVSEKEDDIDGEVGDDVELFRT